MTGWNLFDGVPSAQTYDGGSAVNVGTTFYTSGPAWLTQIRYLQGKAGPDNRWGTRLGTLWAVDPEGAGTHVAAGVFELPAPTANDQWVAFDLPEPFALIPGQLYRIAVMHPDGGYPAVPHWFDGYTDRVTGPVTVPAAGNVPGFAQGSYKYTPLVADIPDSSFNAAAYFADVTITDTLAEPETVFGADGTAYRTFILAGGALTGAAPTP